MSRKRNLLGQTFGMLTVTRESGRDKYKNVLWECECECGSRTIKTSGNLVTGHTQSCGCLRIKRTKESNTTHGMVGSRLHSIWSAMLRRCRNPNVHNYCDYGGRGIEVCGEWQSLEPFRDWAMSNGYTDELSIDRIDNDGNYEPRNCRWTTAKVQNNNTRRNRLIEYEGKTYTIAQLSDKFGVPYKTLHRRISRDGWELDRALHEPVNARCLKRRWSDGEI